MSRSAHIKGRPSYSDSIVYSDLSVFKMAAAAILDFVGSEIWRQRKSRLTRIYLRTKFG